MLMTSMIAAAAAATVVTFAAMQFYRRAQQTTAASSAAQESDGAIDQEAREASSRSAVITARLAVAQNALDAVSSDNDNARQQRLVEARRFLK